MTTELITQTANQSALATVPATPADIVLYAMKNGGSIEQIREFMQLQREWEADQARKAYVADMAEFKKNPPTIRKDKHVAFDTGRGRTEYDHATIGNVTNTIIGALAQHGFSHAWKTTQGAGEVVVTCTITHRLGHSESVTLQSAPDQSGGKNSIQAIISAQTYLQRHTLLAATGLATHDQQDDDGGAAGMQAVNTLIADAARAPDLLALNEIWNTHQAFLRDTSEADWVALKDAVNGRKAALEKRANPTPGQSSRLASIIGAQAPVGGAA
jgi:hypothetical protein